MSHTITGEIDAWLPGNAYGPKDLLDPTEEGRARALDILAFSKHDMTTSQWSKVGRATITVVLEDERTMVDNKVSALESEIAGIEAKAYAEATALRGKIQQLLAIEHAP